ncbi:MAG: TonB-dependent receptor [Desulfatitalea sp.]|nr:TonB-dependent receptor [Desulfatitalea sp.]NNJ99650.1 TonB-dependent receptor [Desulfatitalea sp.]
MKKKYVSNTRLFLFIKFWMIALGLSCMVIFPGNRSFAQPSQILFNIPAQKIRTALTAFAHQADISLIYSQEDIAPVKTNPVFGIYDPVQALGILLEGTGLAFQKTGKESIAIMKHHANVQSRSVFRQSSAHEKDGFPPRNIPAEGDVPLPGKILLVDHRKDYVLEDILVTATRIGETRLQKTPLTLSYFDDESIAENGTESLRDIDLVTPNMTFIKQPKAISFYMRGVGSYSPWSGGTEAIGITVNDVYTPKDKAAMVSLMDVEHIEVLRGPQGTLFGRNTSAGMIRIMTHMPTQSFSGYLISEYGTLNKFGFEGALSGPMVQDKLKGRLAFKKSFRDGFFENKGPDTPETVDDENLTGARTMIQLTPSQTCDFLVSGEYQRFENHGGTPWSFENPEPFVAAGALPWKPLESLATAPIDGGERHQTINKMLSLTSKFELAQGIYLKSITGYFDGKTISKAVDETGTSLLLYDAKLLETDVKSFTQEFQFNARWGKWDLLAGFFFLHEKDASVLDIGLTYDTILEYLQSYGTCGDSYAFYLSGTYPLTQSLSMTLGARYSLDKRDHFINTEMAQNHGTKEAPVYLPWIPTAYYTETGAKTWSDVSPKLGLEYTLTDNAFLYGSITKGYKAGGWNMLLALSPTYQFDPEYVWSYEVGAKTDWLGNRLRANLALFYYNYNDMQISTYGPSPERGSLKVTTRNASSTKIYGGELELSGHPVRELTLGVTVAATFGKYTSLAGTDLEGNAVDQSGNKLMATPEWSFSSFASYVMPVKKYGYVTFSSTWNWQGEYPSDPLNAEKYWIKPRSIFNARVRFETLTGHWFLDAYGRNLTDKRYATLIHNWSPLGLIATPDNPMWVLASDGRIFGVQMGYRF